jgi:hypothetical protein
VVAWLDAQIHFPNWTSAKIQTMPEIKIGDWAATNQVAMDKLYATDLREGGTPALAANVPGYPREELNVFTASQWEAEKTNFILETWVSRATSAPRSEK